MGCYQNVSFYDADAVDALGGKRGRFVETLRPEDGKLAGVLNKRLYVVYTPCCHGSEGDCDDIQWPDAVSDEAESATCLYTLEFGPL